MKALLYCTKGKPDLVDFRKDYKEGYSENSFNTFDTNERGSCGYTLNGKIVAEVEIDKVETISNFYSFVDNSRFYFTKTLNCKELLEKAQLNLKDMQDYLFEDVGYALHLKNLKVFDRPNELFEYDVKPKAFKTIEGYSITNITYSCTNAPQNMCNVYDRFGNKYVLISIQPKHLCKILNGEKTIEVRRKVLNCLKEMCDNE